jgi:hypothetical protein
MFTISVPEPKIDSTLKNSIFKICFLNAPIHGTVFLAVIYRSERVTKCYFNFMYMNYK